jgi:branched-chain amino acid transport system substrate-binding protein
MLIVALVALGAAALAPAAPGATASAPPTTSEPAPVGRDDGILRIGVLMPRSGEASWIGLPASSAARDAVNLVNEAGGFAGEDVELISEDEGASAETASAAIDRLVAQGVDAVIGPASSNVALSTLDRLMAAGIMTCSPTATSLLLDTYPERDLFFRTVPSDSLQMAVVANIVEREGRPTALVFYRNDQYGQGLADVLSRALLTRTQVDATLVPLEVDDDDLTDDAQVLGEHANSTIIVLADQEMGLATLQAIGSTMGELGIEPPSVLVNDAVRGTPEFNLALPVPLLDVLRRVGPVSSAPQQAPEPPTTAAPATTDAASTTAADAVASTSPGAVVVADEVVPPPVGPFAGNAYDCVNLIALAARAASSDDPRVIADGMRDAANTGVPCASYAECARIDEEGLDFNYNGVNSQNTLYQFDANGDLSRAYIMTYRVVPDDGFEQPNGAVGVIELQ